MKVEEITGSQEIIAQEKKYGAHNYSPLPVVLTKGEGVHLWDTSGNRYYDFLSAYSAVNQGHCHPKIIAAMTAQASRLTLTSRAFYNDRLGDAEEFVCRYFGYDKALFMNSGSEAVETAIKLARKWGYTKKGIPANTAMILAAERNFHGRTTGIISFSTDPSSTDGFGPANPGYKVIPYNDLAALERELINHPEICGFLVEPIQGEAGVLIPDEGYLKKAHELCIKHNVKFITDEIQTGIGRTGKMLAAYYDDVHADMLIVGKALSGGVLPVSAVLCDDEIMLCIQPGEHGSTFGGNPVAAAVTIAAMEVMLEEKLTENAFAMGKIFRERMSALQAKRPDLISAVRGKGLLNAIDIIPAASFGSASDICLMLMKEGLLCKATHKHTIRFSPPLVITGAQLQDCCELIERVILSI
jgi:ornithine--oxo-acid transaminase